jgi:hypothetical protein
MRKPVLLAAVAALAVIPAARAQVLVQDPVDTFADTRAQHQARMDANPEKWWGGNVSDRPSSTTLYDPHEFSGAAAATLNIPDRQNPTTGASIGPAPVPGNPNTVKPFFSFDEMNEAGQQQNTETQQQSGIDMTDPAAIEHAAIAAGMNARKLFGGGPAVNIEYNPIDAKPLERLQDLNDPQDPDELQQPIGARGAIPRQPQDMVRQDGPALTAAQPKLVPADPALPDPAAAPEVPATETAAAPVEKTPAELAVEALKNMSPPPVQDEAGATAINPADAPAPADATPAVGTKVVPGADDAPALSP